MYKGAYHNCRFCKGHGCISCTVERKKQSKRELLPTPMFVANRDDPDDMEAFKRVFGGKALELAFGPDGDGMKEIEKNAAMETIKQLLRKGE